MLVFIGTLHGGYTDIDELIRLIERYKADQLLVEITQTDIDADVISDYPVEMQAALNWGDTHDIPVYGFDSGIQPLKPDAPQHLISQLEQEQAAVVEKFDWKDFNKAAYSQLLRSEIEDSIIDATKYRQREIEMSEHIDRLNAPDKTSIVLCGAGYISFFARRYPRVKYPLR